jgi:hypothetical protein
VETKKSPSSGGNFLLIVSSSKLQHYCGETSRQLGKDAPTLTFLIVWQGQE